MNIRDIFDAKNAWGMRGNARRAGARTRARNRVDNAAANKGWRWAGEGMADSVAAAWPTWRRRGRACAPWPTPRDHDQYLYAVLCRGKGCWIRKVLFRASISEWYGRERLSTWVPRVLFRPRLLRASCTRSYGFRPWSQDPKHSRLSRLSFRRSAALRYAFAILRLYIYTVLYLSLYVSPVANAYMYIHIYIHSEHFTRSLFNI